MWIASEAMIASVRVRSAASRSGPRWLYSNWWRQCLGETWASRARLRTGGHSWRLYRDVEHPDTIIERFTVASWSEFERQQRERWLEIDHEGVEKAVGYTVDNSRRRGYYLALRVPR
jgi:Transmembrane secretion effector